MEWNKASPDISKRELFPTDTEVYRLKTLWSKRWNVAADNDERGEFLAVKCQCSRVRVKLIHDQRGEFLSSCKLYHTTERNRRETINGSELNTLEVVNFCYIPCFWLTKSLKLSDNQRAKRFSHWSFSINQRRSKNLFSFNPTKNGKFASWN